MNYEDKYDHLVELKALAQDTQSKMGSIRHKVMQLEVETESILVYGGTRYYLDEAKKVIQELQKVVENIEAASGSLTEG